MPNLLEQIQALVTAGRVKPSGHGARRMVTRLIPYADVCNAVADGVMVESYPDDEEPSLLVLQHDQEGRPFHVVWGVDPDTGDALVITAYYPGLDRWEPGFVTRRRR